MTDAERLRDDVARKLWARSPALARQVHACPAEIDEGLLGSSLVLYCATPAVDERLRRAQPQIGEALREVRGEDQPTEIRLGAG